MIDGEKEQLFKKFGENLKKIREEKNLSLRELAASAGIESAHISRLESGLKSPKLDTLYALAEALKINPRELLP